jgi:glutamine amidotransferase
MKQVAIIDYGSGNLRSAAKAFERAGSGNARISVTDNPGVLAEASHIVLPGVGAFADCMRGLETTPGMRVALECEVLEKRKPFLGVCVGMQMLFETGHEHGMHTGLGWLKGKVVKITGGQDLKIPHMGWNDLKLLRAEHPLLAGLENGDHAYFVHSYHASGDAADVLATTDYGSPLTAIVARGNIMGTQFHPEKSQYAGLKLIANFLSL